MVRAASQILVARSKAHWRSGSHSRWWSLLRSENRSWINQKNLSQASDFDLSYVIDGYQNKWLKHTLVIMYGYHPACFYHPATTRILHLLNFYSSLDWIKKKKVWLSLELLYQGWGYSSGVYFFWVPPFMRRLLDKPSFPLLNLHLSGLHELNYLCTLPHRLTFPVLKKLKTVFCDKRYNRKAFIVTTVI